MFKNIISRFKAADIVGKYIYANVAIYIFVLFIGVFSVLSNTTGTSEKLVGYLELPASLPLFLQRPWTILTYMFLHEHFMHILWNMVALYFFGRVFLQFFSVRHFVGAYIMGGILGGIIFIAGYNLFPYFAPVTDSSFLIGASASVLAIVVASAVRSPEYRIQLFLFGSVKLSTFAMATVAISVLMLSGKNAGGNFAHIGGALAGWLMSNLLNKGKDITSLVNRPIDWIVNIFRESNRKKRRKGKFTYSPGDRNADYEYNARKKASEAEIDRILEKIKKGGYSSLSEEEKKKLFEASSK